MASSMSSFSGSILAFRITERPSHEAASMTAMPVAVVPSSSSTSSLGRGGPPVTETRPCAMRISIPKPATARACGASVRPAI